MAPSAYPLGGVQTWLDYLLPGLRQLGWRCTLGLVAGRFHDPDAYLAVHPGSSVVAIASRTGTQEGRIRSLAGCIARLRPDLVASVNVPDCHAAVARARRRGVRVRTVMTMHGLQADYYEDMAATASKLDAVVCTNRLAWALSTEIGGIEPRRAHYAPYGVGLDRERRRVSPVTLTVDLLIAVAIGLEGLFVSSTREVAGVLILGLAVGIALARLVMEPATTRAAFETHITGGPEA